MTTYLKEMKKGAVEDLILHDAVGPLIGVVVLLKSWIPQIGGLNHMGNYIQQFPAKAILAASIIALSIAAPFMPLALGITVHAMSLFITDMSAIYNFALDKLANLSNKIAYGKIEEQTLSSSGDKLMDINKNQANDMLNFRRFFSTVVVGGVQSFIFMISMIAGAPATLTMSAILAYRLANSTLKDAADVANSKAEEHPTEVNIALGHVEASVGRFASSVRETASRGLGISI